jgi:hypothetical protein
VVLTAGRQKEPPGLHVDPHSETVLDDKDWPTRSVEFDKDRGGRDT